MIPKPYEARFPPLESWFAPIRLDAGVADDKGRGSAGKAEGAGGEEICCAKELSCCTAKGSPWSLHWKQFSLVHVLFLNNLTNGYCSPVKVSPSIL